MNPPFTNVPPAIVLRRTNPFWHAAVGRVKHVYLRFVVPASRAAGTLLCDALPGRRQAELEAEALGVPYDEVLRRLEEGSRQSSQESKHRIREGVAF
jgi:hypothetical protein